MKSVLIIALLLSYARHHAISQLTSEFEKLNWIEGHWTRTDMKPGNSGSERWTRLSATEWQGLDISVKGADTTFVEKIKLIIKDGMIWYVADVRENKAPVYFRLTDITGSRFVCENPGHDFPKKISYSLEGSRLKATISGNGKSIDYFFEKDGG